MSENPFGLPPAPTCSLAGKPPEVQPEDAAREYTEQVQLNIFAHNFHHNVSNRIAQFEGVFFISPAEEAAFDAACKRLARTFQEGIRS